MKIAILLGALPHSRFKKRIELEKQMSELHVICWDRGIKNGIVPESSGVTVHSVLIPAKNDPLKRLIPYLRFRSYAIKELEKICPDVIHLQGFDMLKIACEYKRMSNKPVKIIYEVADIHRLFIMQDQKNLFKKMIGKYLTKAEKKCCREVNLLIVTSPSFVDVRYGSFIPKEKILYMPNVPNLRAFESYEKKNDGEFTVGFIGLIRFKQQMLNMVKACTEAGLKMLFAGYEAEPAIIQKLSESRSDIEYRGYYDYESEVAKLYGKCDVIYAVYDADWESIRVALPNKLYESVYCELPIIVAKGTCLASLVNEWGIGVAVDHRNPEELTLELDRLSKDKTYYNSFVENCKKHKNEIDLQKYNIELSAAIKKLTAESDDMN